jgi:hypothetical protein
VERNIKSVEGTMKKLEVELRNILSPESPKPGSRTALRRHVRRAMYPFKIETVSKIQRLILDARSNLDLSLQVLQMFVYSRLFNDTEK